jgi:hypothetical protein
MMERWLGSLEGKSGRTHALISILKNNSSDWEMPRWSTGEKVIKCRNLVRETQLWINERIIFVASSFQVMATQAGIVVAGTEMQWAGKAETDVTVDIPLVVSAIAQETKCQASLSTRPIAGPRLPRR